ncbi:MAG: hypothetical protein NTV01_21775 [Bacteroidia bacterium]|nr:hypothetical protein [Bacteroidia bacterium]
MICEKCGETFTENFGKYATGRFCSSKCAHSRVQSEPTKGKISNSILKSKKMKLVWKTTDYKMIAAKGGATKLGITLGEWLELQKQHKLPSQLARRYIGCKNCGGKKEKYKGLCEKCKLEYYKYYRPACEFKFSLSGYSNCFDFNLLKNSGMYKAKNRGDNLDGVSRDHMFSIKDGFKQKIDPKIMSHPANCRLMLHLDNNRKNGKSSISLQELKERIKEFDKNTLEAVVK